MVKVVILFRFRDDVPQEECLRIYQDEHPLIVRDVLPDARRYVQGPPLRYRSDDFAWDEFSELWFDDEDSFRHAFRTDRLPELRADEGRFIGHLTWALVSEDVRY